MYLHLTWTWTGYVGTAPEQEQFSEVAKSVEQVTLQKDVTVAEM